MISLTPVEGDPNSFRVENSKGESVEGKLTLEAGGSGRVAFVPHGGTDTDNYEKLLEEDEQ